MKPHKKSHLTFLLPLFLLVTSLFVAPVAIPAATVIDAGFEKGLPREARTYRLKAVADTERVHSGRASLRLEKAAKDPWGTLFFDLDGSMKFSVNCEFSVWVYAEPKSNVSVYISASESGSDRYNVAVATGTIVPGQWSLLTGRVFAGDWRSNESEVKLTIRTHGKCWIDDVKLTTGQPDTPAQIWPRLKSSLQNAANKRISPLKPGDSLVLDARNAALAPDTVRIETSLPKDAALVIPAEGMLVFAIDAKDDLDLTGSIQLEPDADLRPGLRVTVLSDDTVIAAPGVKAAAWKGIPDGTRPGPAPDIRGERPSSSVPLTAWRMTKGRHYITIAGPHIRPGGTFGKLELRASERPAAKPLYSFALLSDTHLGFGRVNWMNKKLNARTGTELEVALRQFKQEGGDFAVIAGDMTDGGKRSQYEELSRVIRRANLPVYGCIGNHDTFSDSSKDIAELIPKLFPDGPENTDYAFTRAPVRFIVLDGSYWRGKNTPIQRYRGKGADETTYRDDITDWLRDTLAKDTTTPTVVISHYHMYLRRGVSPVTGYDFGKGPWMDKKIMSTLSAAPNVVATMNGHLHCNQVATYQGITSIQNPAFVEWPNAYRVFRVYPDRMEWEVRQMSNRGLIREGVISEKALLYMLSTTDADLGGTVSLAPRKLVGTVIDEGFEKAFSPDNKPLFWRVSGEPDTAQARSGSASLRVTPTSSEWGTVAFDLDETMDFSAGCEFSAWIYAKPNARITSYISAQGAKDRHTVANATGKIEPGKWSRLSGKVPVDKWRMDEREVRFVVRVQGGSCWIDDVSLRAVRPSTANTNN